jgi:hypothetical protein
VPGFAWLPHLGHLLWRAFLAMATTALGTTPWRILADLLLYLSLSAIPFAWSLVHKLRRSESVKDDLWKALKASFTRTRVIVVAAFWCAVYAGFLVATIYQDHTDTVAGRDHWRGEYETLREQLRREQGKGEITQDDRQAKDLQIEALKREKSGATRDLEATKKERDEYKQKLDERTQHRAVQSKLAARLQEVQQLWAKCLDITDGWCPA